MGGVWHLVEYVIKTKNYRLENVLEQARIFVTNSLRNY